MRRYALHDDIADAKRQALSSLEPLRLPVEAERVQHALRNHTASGSSSAG